MYNRTIDNFFGDPGRGIMPLYLPKGMWADGQQCLKCDVNISTVDVNRVFNGTWSDATARAADNDQPSISVNFTGSAVYVFHLVANVINHGRTTTFTNLTFHIDGDEVGNFTHYPGGPSSPSIEYNVSVYRNHSLQNGPHAFEIRSASVTNDSLILFDYIVYTTDDALGSTATSSSTHLPLHPSSRPPSSAMGPSSSAGTSVDSAPPPKANRRSSNVGAIVGSSVALVLVIVAGVLVMVMVRKRRSRQLSGKERGIPRGLQSSGSSAEFSSASRASIGRSLHPPRSPAPSSISRPDSRSSLLPSHTPVGAELPTAASTSLLTPTAVAVAQSQGHIRASPPVHQPDVPTSAFSTEMGSSSRAAALMHRQRRVYEVEERLRQLELAVQRVGPRSQPRRHALPPIRATPDAPTQRRRPGHSADVPAPAVSLSGTEAAARTTELRAILRELKEQKREQQLARKRRLELELRVVNTQDDGSERGAGVSEGGEEEGIAALDTQIKTVRGMIAGYARLVDEALPRRDRR